MRNLKKILALVLALVMSLSLMATAGASSFPDVDAENPYATAIEVLDELKVFQGYKEDGTFRPTETLNRAQAAVLVYRIATGDVEDKYLDNYTYMQQSKFTDLDGYNWAKGYINYCQNAGIVVGTTATTFNPGADVTGYQLLVMVLRTLGYGKGGEFTDPKGWELQTAAIAEREGILKNVTGGDFGAPALRQMVAEILFRGLLSETVEYSALVPGGYTKSGVTLGKKTLDLDDIEGVVVANRIADLYDDEPMKDGQTRMIVDGKDYVIDMDTDASAIGLNHHAYVQNGKVLGGSLEADGNVIGEPEHGEAAKVADLAKAAGIKTNADTDYYVNFDEVVSDTSNYRLEYLIGLRNWTEYEVASLVYRNGGSAWVDTNNNHKFDTGEEGFRVKNGNVVDENDDPVNWGTLDNTTTTVDYHYDKVIPAKTIITGQDSHFMKEIFDESDNEDGDTSSDDLFFGEVYVGTKSTLDEHDVSNDISHDEFIEKYINVNENRTISGSDNGEWLRVIDNNGDGVAEYVLRTDFIMTTVVDYEKRTDLYNVEYDVDENHRIISKIPADEIRKDDDVDMSVGAVILYTYIDGYYYISNPEVKSLKVDTKSIEQKKNVFKSDDVEYTWSGIDKEAERYYTDISQISYDVNYDMYFDHFGFVRLATEARRNFVLLTDGYFKTDLRDHEWKVELYNGSEKVETADVVDAARDDRDWNGRRDEGYDGKIDGFIDTFEDDHQGNRGTWKRLNTFGEFYKQYGATSPSDDYTRYVDKNTKTADLGNDTRDHFVTNIALASETDGVWTLQDVTNIDSEFNSLYRSYKVYELAGSDNTFGGGVKQHSLKAKNTDLWGIDGNNVDDDRDTGWTTDAIAVGANGESILQPIQTNGSTLYYYVDGDGKVTSWVGYQNLPEGLENFSPDRAYAVTHEVWNGNIPVEYEIADVVVFESAYAKTIYAPQLITTGINTKRENALGKDSEGEYNEHGVTFGLFEREELLTVAEAVDGLYPEQLAFYDSAYEDGNRAIVSDFEKYGIYAGEVIVADETKHNDYVEIGATDIYGKRISFHSDDVAAYEINQLTRYNNEAAHNLDVDTNDNILRGDKLIVVMEGDVVKMVVNVSASGKDGNAWADRRTGVENDANMIGKLVALYSSINHEWANPAESKITFVLSETSEKVALPEGIADGMPWTEGSPLPIESNKYVVAGYTATLEVKDGDENKCEALVGSANSEYKLYGIKEDLTIEVTYKAVEYTVTANAGTGVDANPTVTITRGDVVVSAPAKAHTGDKVKVEFTTSSVPAVLPLATDANGKSYTVTADADDQTGKKFVVEFTVGTESVTLTLTSEDKWPVSLAEDVEGIEFDESSPTEFANGVDMTKITLVKADDNDTRVIDTEITLTVGGKDYTKLTTATRTNDGKLEITFKGNVRATGEVVITAALIDLDAKADATDTNPVEDERYSGAYYDVGMSASSEYDTETQTGIVTVSVDEDKLRTALSDPDGAGANAVQWMKPSDANYADILAYGFTITAPDGATGAIMSWDGVQDPIEDESWIAPMGGGTHTGNNYFTADGNVHFYVKVADKVTGDDGTVTYSPAEGLLNGQLTRTWKIQFYTGGNGTWTKLGSVQTYTINFQ